MPKVKKEPRERHSLFRRPVKLGDEPVYVGDTVAGSLINLMHDRVGGAMTMSNPDWYDFERVPAATSHASPVTKAPTKTTAKRTPQNTVKSNGKGTPKATPPAKQPVTPPRTPWTPVEERIWDEIAAATLRAHMPAAVRADGRLKHRCIKSHLTSTINKRFSAFKNVPDPTGSSSPPRAQRIHVTIETDDVASSSSRSHR